MRQSAFCNGYWFGRYTERAVAIGRLATSHYLGTSGCGTEFLIAARAAARALGEVPLPSSRVNVQREYLCKQMLFDKEVPSSVLNCIVHAYQDAALIRDFLSDQQWTAIRDAREVITTAADNFRRDTIAETVDLVHEKASLIAYEADISAFGGCVGPAVALGFFIERIYQTMFIVGAWNVTLKEEPSIGESAGRLALEACSAELAYRRHLNFAERPSPEPLAFLLHSSYRRSVISSLEAAAVELSRLSSSVCDRPGFMDSFCRKLERIRSIVSLPPTQKRRDNIIKLLDKFCAGAEAVFCG